MLEEGVAAGVVRGDVALPVVAAHIGRAFEAALRDWAEGRVEDAPAQVELLLSLTFDGIGVD
jgi:hypothetical protein